MKQIGVFLGFGPDQPILNHGLGRVTAFLLKGLVENPDVQPIVVCPQWLVSGVRSFLVEQGIAPEKVSILSPPDTPPIFQLRSMLSRSRMAKPQKPSRLPRLVFDQVGKAADWIAHQLAFSSSMPGLALQLALLLSVGLLLLPILIPVSLVLLVALAIVVLLVRLWRVLPGFIGRTVMTVSRKMAPGLIARLERTGRLSPALLRPWMVGIYSQALARERTRLVALANKNTQIKAWIVPALFWPEVAQIKACKLLVAPDVVYFDMPSGYRDHADQLILATMANTLRKADVVATYSNYVRTEHLVSGLGIDRTKIVVIPHGQIDLNGLLPRKGNVESLLLRHLCCENVRIYVDTKIGGEAMQSWRQISKVPFAFFPSQFRPHKNFMNLLMALNEMIEGGISTALVLTADVYKDPQCAAYIAETNLRPFVLVLSDAPAATVAELYCAAACAINPSLFEGGFPFTFSEAYSVGTPSAMGRIPVTLETISDTALRDEMLFDPYSPVSIARIWANTIANRKLLLARQKTIFDGLKPWRAVASTYIGLAENGPKALGLGLPIVPDPEIGREVFEPAPPQPALPRARLV